MAKRKSAAQEVQPDYTETTPTPVEPATPESPAKRWADKFENEFIKVGGLKIQLQEYRPDRQTHPNEPWQMQIKFGDGSLEQKPDDQVIDFIKSHRLTVTTRDGETKEVKLFRWNDEQRAWAMKIDFDKPKSSREKAKKVFDEVVKLVAQERGATPERSGRVPF